MKKIMMKLLALCLIIVIVGYLIPKTMKQDAFHKMILGKTTIQKPTSDQVSVSMNGSIELVDMDEYLLGVVA